jgi:hypothetical protein
MTYSTLDNMEARDNYAQADYNNPPVDRDWFANEQSDDTTLVALEQMHDEREEAREADRD